MGETTKRWYPHHFGPTHQSEWFEPPFALFKETGSNAHGYELRGGTLVDFSA